MIVFSGRGSLGRCYETPHAGERIKNLEKRKYLSRRVRGWSREASNILWNRENAPFYLGYRHTTRQSDLVRPPTREHVNLAAHYYYKVFGVVRNQTVAVVLLLLRRSRLLKNLGRIITIVITSMLWCE